MHRLTQLAKNVVISNVSDLSVPYKLTFALTYRCQLKCVMCGIWKKQPVSELSLEEISEFFRVSPFFSWVNLSGGEIFLRPDLTAIARAIDKNSRGVYLLNFPTNGYQPETIVPAVKEILRTTGFPKIMVTVSLDGPSDLHDRIRNTPGAWDRAVETYAGLREMRSRRFQVYFGMTLQDLNSGAFEETVRAVRQRIPKLDYRDIHVNVLHASPHYYGKADCPTLSEPEKIGGVLEDIQRVRRDSIGPVGLLERRYQRLTRTYLTSGRTPVACEALSASCFIAPSGTVYPCSAFDKPLENIRAREYRISAVWDTEHRRALRREIRSGQCPQCWTPCEAYQSLLANLVPRPARERQ